MDNQILPAMPTRKSWLSAFHRFNNYFIYTVHSSSDAPDNLDLSWIPSCIPDTFSRRTRVEIEKGVLTKGQRVEITEVTAYRALAHTKYSTSTEYNALCQSLTTKYPNIKDTIGNGYVSCHADFREHYSCATIFYILEGAACTISCMHELQICV